MPLAGRLMPRCCPCLVPVPVSRPLLLRQLMLDSRSSLLPSCLPLPLPPTPPPAFPDDGDNPAISAPAVVEKLQVAADVRGVSKLPRFSAVPGVPFSLLPCPCPCPCPCLHPVGGGAGAAGMRGAKSSRQALVREKWNEHG